MACKETGTLNTQGHPQNAGTSLPVLLGGVWWTWCTCQTRICCTKSCWALFSFSQTLWFLPYCTSDICRSGFKQNATCHSVPICLGSLMISLHLSYCMQLIYILIILDTAQPHPPLLALFASQGVICDSLQLLALSAWLQIVILNVFSALWK